MLQHIIVAFSVAAIVAPFSYYMGLGARLLKLPQITGYLISGIICGPYILGILSSESVVDLNIIESACLSIIGLAAGAELDLPQLTKSRKQVLGITIGICVISWVLCYATFDWLLLVFPLKTGIDARHLLAIASLGATLMMTRSPASAIAVLKELDGKGPFCSLVMAVVVVKDVVVIMAFALNIELIRAVILPANAAKGLSALNLLLPLLSILLSMSLGVLGGFLLGILMQPRFVSSIASLGGAELATVRVRMGLLVLLCSLVFQLAVHLDAEPLLACVTMGMLVVNRRHERADKEREELHHMLAHIMSISNVAFFGLAGASLKLSALKDMFGAAIVVALVRILAIYVGSWLGCFMTATTMEVRRLFWCSMVTQAGVAMGLARLAGTRFPDWGPHFQTFMMSIILINLLIGPPLFRFALIRTGEARAHAALPLQHRDSHKERERERERERDAVSSGGAISVGIPQQQDGASSHSL